VIVRAHRQARRGTWAVAIPIVCASYLLSQFCKETGIVTLPLLVLAGRYIAGGTWRASIFAASPVALLSLGYLVWRWMVFSTIVTGGDFNFFVLPLKAWLWRYVYFWFEVLVGLNLDDVKVILGPRAVIVVFFFIVGLSLLILRQVRRFCRALAPSLTLRFCAAAFALTVLPVVYLPALRNLYLPLVGVSMGIGLAIEQIDGRLRGRRRARRAFIVGLVALAIWRTGIIYASCSNNGRTGDMFHRNVTQLDQISATASGPDPQIHVFAAAAEILTPFLLDTPWVICGGEAGKYQQLVYGQPRATFHYHMQTMWRRYDVDRPSIALSRPRDEILRIELGPQVQFHWGEGLGVAQPFGRMTMLGSRPAYRVPTPNRVGISLEGDLLSGRHVLVGFDGIDMRVRKAPCFRNAGRIAKAGRPPHIHSDSRHQGGSSTV
jgi:hypothetical protein